MTLECRRGVGGASLELREVRELHRSSRAVFAAAVLGILSGCALGSAGFPEGSGGVPPGGLIRRVTPFPVADASGRAYTFPFLGGFNVPRPQLVDLDGDRDLDLVIQEYTGRLMAFENQSSAAGGVRWEWRPELLAEVDVGEWYRFVDSDGDGDPDLFGEEPFSYIRLYRNRGSGAHAPVFELAVDTLRDDAGEPIFSDRQNIPNAADLDCDGRLDLLLGRTVGTITHYEAVAPRGPDAPRFTKLTDQFERIQIIGVTGPQLPPGGSRHGANTMALADNDGDGDLDLFWGDFFEPGLLLIENTGTCEAPVLSNPPQPFPIEAPVRTSGYNAPTFGDLDGDGNQDLLLGVLGGAFNANSSTVDNLLHFERVETRWEQTSTRYISQLDVGSESVPALLDLDGDGDLDLLVANKLDPADLNTSYVYRLENVGTRERPSFREAGRLELATGYHQAPAFGDLDGDGDADLVLGTFGAELRLLRNQGTRAAPRFVSEDDALVTLTRGSNATPALGDLDADGDLDLMIGEASGAMNSYRNAGSATEPRFELVSDEYGGIKVERRSAPALVDWDGDGDLDLLVGTEREGVRFWRNEGSPREPRFVEAGTLLAPGEVHAYNVPLPADLDGDGDLDLLVGGLGGGLLYFERTGR